MKIYFDNTFIEIKVDDNSYRYRAIRGEHALTLYFSLPEHVEIPVGAWCEFENETYTLEKPENFKMHSVRNFEYTVVMDAAQAKLSRFKFKDTTTRRLKFMLTAKPHEHLQMLVDNMNRRDTGWTAGNCVDAAEKPLSYNHTSCMDALNMLADEFETEWEITGKTIHLYRVEYNKSDPLPLSYGRGNGFKSGVGRTNSNGEAVEILFVQGGERNIDPSRYGGSKELLLPKNQTLVYEGRTYVVDEDGFSIRRADKELRRNTEDSLDCSHIYPSRVGEVTAVEVVDAEKHFYDFFDTTIPADLDFAQYRIDGEKITVVFQSGMLAGKEFDIEQSDSRVTGYIHAERRFKLASQDLDGRTMPDEVFCPRVGDKYAVFGMMMPDAYVCDDATKTGASWEMFREAAKYLYEHEEQRFTFTGELDGIWAKQEWATIGGKMRPGGYILFSDMQFQPEGVAIRIVGIKDYINNPYSPTVELSNDTVGGSIISEIRKIDRNEVIMDDLHSKSLLFAKRRFRDSVETMKMLENSLLENFSDAITPITVRTMQLLIGDESLQFRFVNNKTNPAKVEHVVSYDAQTKRLTSAAGILQHLTLGIDTIAANHDISEYKFWDIPTFVSDPLTDAVRKYYLYAKVSKTEETGEFYLSETPVAMGDIEGFYNLLVGVLNSEYEGERSYVSLYGFTEITPGRITSDVVVSNVAHIGDWLIRNGEIVSKFVLYNNNGTWEDRYATDVDFDNSAEQLKIKPRISLSAGKGDSFSPDSAPTIRLASIRETFSGSGIDRALQEMEINTYKGTFESKINNNEQVTFFGAGGLYTRTTGTNPYPPSLAIRRDTAVAGIKEGYVRKINEADDFSANIGVLGTTPTTETIYFGSVEAPEYGGFFTNLMAKGLNIGVKLMQNVHFTETDDYGRPSYVLYLRNRINNECYFSLYHTVSVSFIFQPPSWLPGKVYFFRLNNNPNVYYQCIGGEFFWIDGSIGPIVSSNRRNAIIMIVSDGDRWLCNIIQNNIF